MMSSAWAVATSLTVATILPPLAAGSEAAPIALADAPIALGASGVRSFDFLIGRWHVHHRRLKIRLADSHEWERFEGTTEAIKILGGLGNMDDNVLDLPDQPYRAVTLRAFDPTTGLWSIWWLDGRYPGSTLEPAVRGQFHSGVGTFFAEDTYDGRPIRVRFLWSDITPVHCRWEQAFSIDQGRSWEVNWIMEFERDGPEQPESAGPPRAGHSDPTK